jgi:formylglycine-generating enzyme required for sulfatase activity
MQSSSRIAMGILALVACRGDKAPREGGRGSAVASSWRPPDDMARIPAGTYKQRALHLHEGGTCNAALAGDAAARSVDNWPDEAVQVSSFEIDRNVVMWVDYCECERQHVCPHAVECPDGGEDEDDPLNNAAVPSRDAAAYCAWRGLRVPTYGEWQAAVRGIDGIDVPTCDAAAKDGRCRFTTSLGVQVWISSRTEYTRSRECFPPMLGNPAVIDRVVLGVGADHLGIPEPADEASSKPALAVFRCVRDALPGPT